LINYSYLLIGVVQAMAGYVTYLTVLYDTSYKPTGLIGLTDAKWDRFCQNVGSDRNGRGWPETGLDYTADALLSMNGKKPPSTCGDGGNWQKGVTISINSMKSDEDANIRLCGRFYPRNGGSSVSALRTCLKDGNCTNMGANVLENDCNDWWTWTSDMRPEKDSTGKRCDDPDLANSAWSEQACMGELFSAYEYNLYCAYNQLAGANPTVAQKQAHMKDVSDLLLASPNPGILQMVGTGSGQFGLKASNFLVKKNGMPYCRTYSATPGTTAQATTDIGNGLIQMPAAVIADSSQQEKFDAAFKSNDCHFPDYQSSVIEAPADGGGKDGYAKMCWNNEAVKAAQTSFLAAIVIVQFSNLWFCKTRMLSLLDQGFRNRFQNWSILSEFGVAALLAYVPGINMAFQTRQLEFWHFCVPAMPFAVYLFVFDEWRKMWVRRGNDKKDADPNTLSLLDKFGIFVWSWTYY